MKDEVIEEIRAIRHQISAEFDHDIHKYCAYLMREEEEMRKQGAVFSDPPKVRIIEPESLVLREEPKK